MTKFIETHYIEIIVSMAIFAVVAGFYTDEVLAITVKLFS